MSYRERVFVPPQSDYYSNVFGALVPVPGADTYICQKETEANNPNARENAVGYDPGWWPCDMYVAYDISGIPHGAQILRAKFDYVAGIQNDYVSAGVVKYYLTAMEKDGVWNGTASLSRARQYALMRCQVRDSASTLIEDLSVYDPDAIEYEAGWCPAYGISAHGQACRLQGGNGTIGSVTVYGKRIRTLSGEWAETYVYLEIWTASGASGAYVADKRVAVSNQLLLNDLETTVQPVVFTFDDQNQYEYDANEVVCICVRNSSPDYAFSCLPGSTSSPGWYIAFQGGKAGYDDTNEVRFGPSQWIDAGSYAAWNEFAELVPMDGAPVFHETWPEILKNEQRSFGDAGFTPAVTDAEFELGSLIQHVITQTGNDGKILFRFKFDTAAPGAYKGARRWVNAQQEVVDPCNGMTLTVQWDEHAHYEGKGRVRRCLNAFADSSGVIGVDAKDLEAVPLESRAIQTPVISTAVVSSSLLAAPVVRGLRGRRR